MAGDKFDQLYNALKADGAVSGTRENFKKFVYAPGKQGYQNRLRLYNSLKADGAVSSGSYEEFSQRLGLHAVKPKQQSTKPQTTSQRAMQIGGRQLPKPKNVPSNASPFVKSLYAKDLMERGEQQPTDYVSKREDYTSPKAVQNMSRRSQRAGRVAAENAAAEIDEQYMQSQPVMNTGTPADEYVGKTERQLEKQIADSGADLVNSDNSDKSWIDDMVNNEIFVKAQQRADKAYSEGNWHINPADDQMDELFHTRKSNAEFDQGKMIKSLEETLKTKASEWLSRPETIKKIQGEAQRLGIDVDTYISRSVVPALYNKVSSRLAEKNLDRYMPRSSFDYILGGITEGLTATLGEFANNETKSQKELRKQAVQLTREGKNPHFKPNTWDNAGRGGVAFMSDMPWYTLSGLGATAATEKLFGSAAKQMAVRASQNLAQRVLGDVAKGAVHGYLTGFQFGFVNGAVQNFSTGEDTSLGGTLKAALKGASEEGASFAVMEGMGGLSGALGYKIGLKGTEKGFLQASKRAVQKVGYETVKTGLEGLGMASGGVASSYANHLLTGEDWHGFTKEGTLESCASAVIFKLTHAKEIFKGEKGKDGKRLNFMDGVAQKTSRFFMSDEAKLAPHVFTEDEKAQLFNAGSNIGMKPMDNIISFAKQAKKKKYDVGDDPYKDTDIELIGNAYDQIMADPKVSWDAKAKFTTLVMGTMPESRPMMDYCTFTTEKVGGDEAEVKKYINEYSADGTLLSKTSYDNTDKREQALYKMAMTREGQRLWNVMGTLVGIDKNNYDYQNAFFTERVKDAKDGAEIQAFVDGMGTKGSAVEQEFTNWVLNNGSTMKAIDAFARESGMKKEDIVKLMNKDPLHRTEEEQLLCVKLRRELEKQAFPADKVHEEQSNLEGKDVADDNSLGTEEPKTEAVAEQLDNLSKAEEGVEALMRDNDVFGDNFKKMQDEGMTNPQIYDWMIRNGGMTQEQLKPFADYINANARVQGMQQRTQQKIEEVVGKVVHDWSYRGTMNGAKSDGEQVLYVEDRDGRRLMVGSGDVAFDSVTGRAKEDVGDMLVCLDPETKELVYIKAEDAKFVGDQKPEDFANEYRQKLQEINSQPYNEAMQRQAERDASKEEASTSNSSDKHLAEHSNDESDHLPTQENDIPSVEKDTNNSSNSNGNEGTLTHSDADYEKNDIPADKDGELVYEQVPKERTVEDLFGKLGGDGNLAHSFAEAKVAEAEKEQKALLKKEPKMGTKINEYLKKKREYEDAVKAAEAKVAYWNDVKGEIEKLTHTTLDEMKEQQAELDGTAAAAEHKALYGEGQPADGTALAAKFVADAKITPDSFKKETGFGTAEQAGFVGMIAKEENGGKSIERLAEDLVYYDNTEYNGTYFRNDTNEARNAIISALGAARTRKGLRELAQPNLAKFESERAQERDNAYHEAYGMDYEEYLAYSEQEMPHILEKINNFDEEKYLHDKAEEITNQIDKEYGKAIRRDESAGEEPVHGEGDKVLPGTRTDERGGGESPEGHAGRTEAERRSDTENAALPEEASAGRVEEEQQKEVDEAVKHVATEITKQTGIDVVTDERKGQSALEDAEAGGTEVKKQAMLSGLTKAANAIKSWIKNGKRGKVFTIELPVSTQMMIKKVMGRDFDSHNITANGVAHALKNHGENGKKLTEDSIPLRNEDLELLPYIMTAPDYVMEGSSDVTGRRSIRFYKELSNGYVVVAEKEYKNSPDDMETITMWAEKSDKATNAQRSVAPDTHVRNAILDIDAAKIRKDAEIAIENDKNNSDVKLSKAKARREFRTKDGEVYGFTVDGKIYLDTKKMKPETPLHEYTHLWSEALKNKNPKEWENVKKLFDDVEGLKEEVQKLYPELEGDALYDEMIATYSGREGTKKLEAVVRELAAKSGSGVAESVKEQGFIYKVKEALQRYWKGVADMLHIHFTTAEEVADKVLADWAKGVKPDEVKEPIPILPKSEKPDQKYNPIEYAAAEFKKEHPMTEEEILKCDADDVVKDMALDYLNGEVTDDLHRAIYESLYAQNKGNKTVPKVEDTKPQPKTKVKEAQTEPKPQKPVEDVKTEEPKVDVRKADDAAVAASNKKVNDLWAELRKAGRDEMAASLVGLTPRQLEVLPKLVGAMAENAYLRIKRGMHNLDEMVKEMRKEFAPAAKYFDKENVDAIYEQMMNIRYRDGEQRMSLKDWADYYEKTSPAHKENLVGDSKEAEYRKQSEKKFIDRINTKLAFGDKLKGIVQLRKIAEECGLKDIKDTDLQELVETAIVQRARGIATSESTNDAKKFERIMKLYENQPSLNQRDSERVQKQQYSTPAPYAFVADMWLKGNGKEVKSALEPSAGNGMLTIGLPMDAVHVNDIDAQRLANLRRQGFKNVTSQDGTQPFADKDVDVVITNPPFGSATPKEYDGYTISSLEGQMAINALESMKDDGRAAIIIGGKTEYAKNGSLKPKDKAFLGYLYSHYNVEDVINVDGSLYAKQGTTYPTRIILINGRRKYDSEHKVFPPVEKDARAETVKDYDELYKRIEDDILRSKEQPVDIRRNEVREGDKPSGGENVSDSTEENGGRGRLGTTRVPNTTLENSEPSELDPSTRPVEQSEDANGRPVEATGNGDSNTDGGGRQTSAPESGSADGGSERGGNVPSGGNEPVRNGDGENGRERGVRHGTGHIQQPLDSTPKEEKKQTLATEKVKYQPHSSAYSIGAVVPARQKEALDNVLNKLGDADQYLVDNLGYNDKEDLYAHLAAEQIDAVALGLKQMEKGNGFIIGDQTGIGKGRQAAAIIRYAVKQGRIPISFTQKANLFSDTYRDLNDIGSPELRPFILASSNEGNIKVNYDEEVKGLDGKTTTVRKQKVVYKVPSKAETESVLKYIAENGKLPEGYDYILTTYSQIRNGMEEWKGGKWKAKKKVTATDRNGQMKRDAIKRIAENSIFILDESHDAAGEGSGSAFIQEVLPKVKGVTFLSATYAKTPDAMKLYALKTDLGGKSKEEGENGNASWKVMNAIKRGGAVFQEIMSQALTKSGQMIRRERDMTGVTIDWNPLTENEVEIQGQRDKFDNIFGIFNDILNFQRTYVDAKLEQMSDDLAFIQGSADHTPGAKDMGIGNVTFASKAYNVVQQALFSIKAEKVADYAIEAIKNGEKPVIAVNNTMGSMIDEYPMGVEMDMPDLNSTLMKGLEGILRYTEKNDMGDQVNSTLRVEELGEEAVARYNEIKQKITSVSSGLSISPIDVIKHRLEEAGYKVGELTGRNTEMVYTENGKVIRKNRTDKNKNALADRFNNGDLDALILNRSAAAGISLHASSKYKDQRQRTMIFAQMQGNINDEVQIRGRIDRTGQVRRGKYVYLVSAIPAEQRLMMMFKNKLKSLDANTTSSQKSKFNEVDVQDFTNKYGDEIVLQYMAQHPEYYNELADPLGWGFMEYAKDGLSIGELKYAMKSNISSPAYEVMKRLTLLPVKEQEVVLKDISDSYSQKIKQLNDMGMNDLEMTDMPLEAKTLKREVWKKGSDPDGDNAFADNTYIETVEMNVLKKPMKAEDVESVQKKMLDGKDYETWRKDKIAEIRAAQQAKIEDTKSKMAEQTEKKVAKIEESTRLALEKENAKIQKKIDKGEELRPGEHVLTEEEINTRVDTAVDEVKRRLSEKLSDAIGNINVKYDMFVNPLFAFDPNKTISVPNDWYMEEASTSLYPEFGRVIGFKYDKNYNLGSSSIVIATTDSRKRVEIPLNRPAVFERIQADSERFSKECKVVNMDAWDRMIPKKDRTTGRIITGNMLEALADNSSIGHLISYTTDDGKVKQGILVPDSVSTAEITGNMPISKAYNWFTKKSGGTELASTDGTLRLTKNFGSMYTLFVPASRKEGGKYYLNQDLLDLVHGHNFQSKGKNFWATFDAEKLKDVLNVLNGMGVEVKTPYDYSESVHFRIKDNKTEKQNNSVATISEDAPVVVKHVDRVSKETGVKVNMVQSAEEVSSPRVKKALEDGEQVTGWYDEKTGEVHLYMPNIHDRYTAEKTIWHETVGHKGMRGLMGEQFDRFLRDVWYDLDKPENAELKKLVDEERRRNPLNIYDAIEEGIARLAEEGRGEPGFWRNIRNKVTDFFREIGYRIAPNTKDVKYLLWLSKNLQKNPNDVFYKMRAEAVRWRLDHETVPDVIEANGMFFDNDGKAHKSYLDMSKEEYEEATDGEIHLRTTPSAGTAIDRYHRALNEHGYMFTESYMDNMLSLQKLMLAIKPGMKIEDIKSSENPYMLQNTMQGKMSTMAQRFNDDVMEPLNKVMAKALDAFDGKNQTEKTRSFNLYMIAKHGLERNRVFFVRDYIRDLEPSDAEILQRQWDAEKKDLGDKLRNGQIDLKEYYKTMDEWIRNNVDMDYKADEHDYSGFHGLQEIDDKKAPYDDAEAIQSVMDSEAKMEDIKNDSVADLWSKINTATRYSLDLEYDGSMLTKENHDHVSEMFDWYVPLRKYDEATAEDMYGYVSENGDATTYIGPALMKAKGRKSLSNVNVLAQIGAMGNMSISRYGNNAVKMAFARFVRSNGGQGLVTETNLWVEKKGVDNNGKPIWEEAYPKIPENATADEISKIVSDFETDMKAKQAKGEARNLSARGHIGFKFERAKDRDQHIVDVMIAGKNHRFVVNGNPRAAQALNGLLEHKAGGVGRVFATISRFMAQTCTSYNPEFVMRNMIRDFEFASSNLLAKEGLKYTKVFEKYYAKVGLIEGIRNSKIKDLADTGGFGLYAKYRNGTLDTSNKIQGYFKEFMDNGGETGWVQVKNMKDLSKEYRRNIKTERSKVAKVGKGFYNLIFKNLENVNEIAENMARFATYCASRDSGRSVVRSAYDAKEVSTNFNRHGSASAIKSFKNGEMSGMQNARKQIYRFTSSYFRNTSMFFNAGIQSTNLLIKNFKHNPIGTAGYIAAGPMITAGLMALLNNVMIASEDEKDRKGVKDPYGELPDYIRRNNLCVYIGEGEFVTIPLAIEERAFYGLGDFVAGMTFADNISSQKMANLAENKKVDKWLNPAMDAVGCLSQLVPVMDYLGHASFGKEPVQETVKGFAPSAISPIVEWLYNSDWKGSPIQRDDKFDEEQPSWMLAYKGTPGFLVDINKKVNAATNTVAPGNENMKGNDFWDAVTNPSALQHFYSGYMGGAATFAERAVGLVKKGKDVETKDIPFVRSLLYTPNEQSSLQRTKTKWYNYQDEMAKTMSNVKRLKSKNVPADQLLRNYSDYFKFQDSKEAMKVQVIEEADKMIKEWKKLRNKSSDTESINYANHNIEMIMQESVDKLDKLSE